MHTAYQLKTLIALINCLLLELRAQGDDITERDERLLADLSEWHDEIATDLLESGDAHL